MKAIITALLAVALSACASSGVRVTDDQVMQFHEGQTTKQEVVTVLGQPTQTFRNSDGTSMLQYVYAESQVRGSTFIPVVGIFAGGVDTRTNTATFNFDKNGILESYSTSGGEIGTSTGVSTPTGGQVSDQPRR